MPLSFQIATDSTTDLTAPLYREHSITVLPLHFAIDGTEFLDGWSSMTPEKFFGLLRSGKISTTSAVNFGQFIEAFTPILERGEDILYLGFTGALSSTSPTAEIAAVELRAKYPARRIVVIDTLCASAGEGLLVLLAARRRDRGESLEQTADWVREHAPHVQHWFTVDSLSHLYRGGRLSAVSAMVGGALGIKPVLTVTGSGRLAPAAKVRGRRAALLSLAARLEENGYDPHAFPEIIIVHADAGEDARFIAGEILGRHPGAKISFSSLGAVIGSHTGPGTAAVFFLGARR